MNLQPVHKIVGRMNDGEIIPLQPILQCRSLQVGDVVEIEGNQMRVYSDGNKFRFWNVTTEYAKAKRVRRRRPLVWETPVSPAIHAKVDREFGNE